MDFSEGYKDVFTENDIQIALNANIPDHILNNKKKLEVWNTKQKKRTVSYKNYCNVVTGGGNTWEDHLNMWNKYKSKLQGRYCVHSSMYDRRFYSSYFSDKAITRRLYSTERGENVASHLLSKYLGYIENTFERNPHGGLILAGSSYREPYPLVNQTDLLCLTAMDLLIQYAYPTQNGMFYLL